jgi:hypothetical protein
VFYRLKADPGVTGGLVRKEDNMDETLMSGALIDESELTLPWPFVVVVNKKHGLEISEYHPGAKVMSKRLVAALQAAGVDNLQTFPAEIKNSDTGEIIRDFVAVNIIGMVSAADEAASESSPLADVKFFHKLVMDPTRAKGLRMFRLAESRMDVIVDETVAEAIRAGDFTDVVLEPVEEGKKKKRK